MSEDEADAEILSLATEDTGKFAIGVGYPLPEPMQLALERGMQNEWFRLVDVSFVEAAPTHLCRIFLLTAAGRWRRSQLKIAGLPEPAQTGAEASDEPNARQHAISWMRSFAYRAGLTYERVIEIGREHLATGYLYIEHDSMRALDAYCEDRPSFWEYFGQITGITPPTNPSAPFSSSIFEDGAP